MGSCLLKIWKDEGREGNCDYSVSLLIWLLSVSFCIEIWGLKSFVSWFFGVYFCFFFFSFNFIFYEVLKYWYIFLCKKEKKFLAFLHCASPKTVECYTQCWSAFDTSQSWKWFQNPIEWGFYCLFWQLRSPTQSTDKMPTAPASFSHVTACWEPAPKQNWERK